MNYTRLLQEITGKPYPPLPERWEHRLDSAIPAILTSREKDILERNLDGETLRSIANSYSLSSARLGQLRHRAINKLRRAFLKRRWIRFTQEDIDRYLARERKPLYFETLGRGETWSVGFAHNPNLEDPDTEEKHRAEPEIPEVLVKFFELEPETALKSTLPCSQDDCHAHDDPADKT
jgi:hypothetical protein